MTAASHVVGPRQLSEATIAKVKGRLADTVALLSETITTGALMPIRDTVPEGHSKATFEVLTGYMPSIFFPLLPFPIFAVGYCRAIVQWPW